MKVQGEHCDNMRAQSSWDLGLADGLIYGYWHTIGCLSGVHAQAVGIPDDFELGH